MYKQMIFLLALVGLACAPSPNIDREDYSGGWKANLASSNYFNFEVELKRVNNEFVVQLSGNSSETSISLARTSTANSDIYSAEIEPYISVRLKYEDESPEMFFQTGHHLSYIDLKQTDDDKWTGKFDLLISGADIVGPTFYLAIDEYETEPTSAYLFIKEPTYHYCFVGSFRHKGGEISFQDIRSNLAFEGVLQGDSIEMDLSFLGETHTCVFHPFDFEQWEIGAPGPMGKEPRILTNQDEKFSSLIQQVYIDTLEGTHSILLQESGIPVLEVYYDGFTEHTLHDTRSVAKSFASTITGIAISEEYIPSDTSFIKPYFERDYPNIDWRDEKSTIRINHLLSMSSGLDAIDFGLNRESYANEGNYQAQNDWTEYILSAPMVYPPGARGNYGSGNPHLLGPIVGSTVHEGLAFYIHEKLFNKLGMTNYRIQTDNSSEPYFGGGWYLSSRDLINYGQLYLDQGQFNGEQIISKSWVEKSMNRLTVLENTTDQIEYGYLFWHKTYEVNGELIASVEARGSGGQYLFIIPQYNLVAVITSGNYRNGKAFQPERIMEDYILPQIAGHE